MAQKKSILTIQIKCRHCRLVDIILGTQREIFFLNMLFLKHTVQLPLTGDFLVDNCYLFEIAGRNKSFEQLKAEQNAFLALDGMKTGFGSKIPLWLFGLLY